MPFFYGLKKSISKILFDIFVSRIYIFTFVQSTVLDEDVVTELSVHQKLSRETMKEELLKVRLQVLTCATRSICVFYKWIPATVESHSAVRYSVAFSGLKFSPNLYECRFNRDYTQPYKQQVRLQ